MKIFYLLLFSIILVSLNCFSSTDTVRMYNNYFEPDTIHIEKGDRIIWINMEKSQHTSTSGIGCTMNGLWNSGYLRQEEMFIHEFDSAGYYPYYCIPHCSIGMVGLVIVGDTEQSSKVKRESYSLPLEIFNSSRIINTHSTKTLNKNVLNFLLMHRFSDVGGANGGAHRLFGLDRMRDVRIAFEYGITDDLMVGISRSKGDWYNKPQQTINELYEGLVKYRFINQAEEYPFSITLFGNAVLSAMEASDISGIESNFSSYMNRFSYTSELIIGKQFTKGISWQLTGTYLRRNWAVSPDEKDLFALSTGGAIRISKLFGVRFEYSHLFSEYRNENHEFTNSLALGVEFYTGGHVFHVNFTNATGLIPNTYLPYTTGSWGKAEFRFGFTISRRFNL